MLRSSAFLPQQNSFANPVGNQLPVTGRVVFQQRLHHLRKLFPGKRWDFQLLSVQSTLVEDGAIVKGVIPGKNCNIVQVAVVIEYKAVDFKQQRFYLLFNVY